MRDYRLKKLEYYGKPVGFLNFYMHFLLPGFLIYFVVRLTWQATVPGAAFASTYAFLIEFWMVAICFAALVAIGNVDVYSFFSSILAVLSMAAYKVLWTISPGWLTGSAAPAGEAVPVGAEQAGEMMAGMSPEISMMASGGMMDEMAGAAGGSAGGGLGALLTKLLKTDKDVTTFVKTLECEMILVICGLVILYFISHRKLFFTSLEKFRQSDQ